MDCSLQIFHIENYSFGTKEGTHSSPDDLPYAARMERLEEEYQHGGTQKSVAGVLLTHDHNHPHVLLLQIAGSTPTFKLPGDVLAPGDDEIEGLRRHLDSYLKPTASQEPIWDIGESLAQWCRPNFESYMYPYTPAHVSRPKEIRKLFLVRLDEKCIILSAPLHKSYNGLLGAFAVPRNYQLLAVPLFELYENTQMYGAEIASIPYLLSRYNLICSK